jgi:CHAT domain-containing protein
MDSRFKVEVVSFTPNPQQIAYAAMHQDYAEEFVLDDRDRWPDEAKAGELIVKYLLQGGRGHYGPLEHPQIILNFGYFPHSVMQQMRTHRNVSFDVQCLAADTEITFDDPVKLDSHSKETIGELYKLWAAGETAVRDRMRKMPLRVLNEDTGRFEVSHLKDILCSGIQSIYRLTLTDGKTLDCTINHRLFTVKGWQTMANAVELVTDDQGNVLNFKKTCEVMCNGVVLDKLISQNLIEEGQVTHVVSPLPNPPLRKGREPNPDLTEPSSVPTQSSKPSSTLAVPPSPNEGEGLGVRSAMQFTPPLLTQCRSLSAIAPAQQSSLPANLIPNKLQIHQTVTTAYRQAQHLSDRRSEADALGYLGAIAFQSAAYSDATQLTEQALQRISTYEAPDIAYRWLWQLGRIHQQQGHVQEAIAAYRAAFNILKSLRGDLVATNPDVQFTFRDEVEPIYRELASLLLADTKPNEKALQEARDVIESLQLAELNNFFQQACLEARPQPIDQIDPKAAVLYSITLSDRLAVITSIPGKPLQYNTVPLAAAPSPSPSQRNALDQTVEDLEATLNPFIASPDPLQPSQQLYNWLIRPVEPELVRNDIKTLVFVMDGMLRRVPLAALHDGQRYLVEKYNVALTPGLQLLTPRSTQTKSLKTLVGGLVASRQGFPPLPAVQQEVQEISGILPTQVLLDDQFTRDRLQQNIENATYPVVHLATHAQFSSRAENTFLLTWDERINVKSLDQFLRQRERRLTKNPIELLILSACQTAAGDNRAALGLAGVAMRSGARSTMATLWSVQDQSTANLMAQFYAALDKPGISKAAALRQAQLSLLRSPQMQYHHPYYWAPFVLIGNWL